MDQPIQPVNRRMRTTAAERTSPQGTTEVTWVAGSASVGRRCRNTRRVRSESEQAGCSKSRIFYERIGARQSHRLGATLSNAKGKREAPSLSANVVCSHSSQMNRSEPAMCVSAISWTQARKCLCAVTFPHPKHSVTIISLRPSQTVARGPDAVPKGQVTDGHPSLAAEAKAAHAYQIAPDP